MNSAFARLIEDARPDRRDNRPLIMEPEDEIRALREEVAMLRSVLLDCANSLERLQDRDGAYRVTCLWMARKALNPAKFAAPLSPG